MAISDEQLVERLERIEDRIMAISAVAQSAFQHAYPQGGPRRFARDTLCGTLESLYAEPRVPITEHGHHRLQRALAYLEEMVAG